MTKYSKNEKFEKAVNVVLFVFATITLVNYITYFIHMLFFPESTTAYIISAVVIIITLFPVLLQRKLEKFLGKTFKYFKGIWGAGLAFYVVSFTVMCAVIFIGAGSETPAEEVDEGTVFIVYGAKVRGDANAAYPGSALKRRLDCAYDIMKEVPDSVCIVTGGRGENENAAEGDVMKEYLVSLGFDARRIYVEDKSANTLENIKFSKEIIASEGLSNRKIACVSTGFHIPRISLLCNTEGLDISYWYYAESSNPISLYTSLVREYMSYWKLILTGYFR